MRKSFLLIIVILSIVACRQKVATTFKEATENKGISIEELDATYQSALNSDSSKAVFKGREQEFYTGYVSLLTELNTFLNKKNFSWDKETKCFNRIYMNKDGGIDYFLFNFKPGEIDVEKEKRFQELLTQFIETYRFPITSNVNFAQCSPVTYGRK